MYAIHFQNCNSESNNSRAFNWHPEQVKEHPHHFLFSLHRFTTIVYMVNKVRSHPPYPYKTVGFWPRPVNNMSNNRKVRAVTPLQQAKTAGKTDRHFSTPIHLAEALFLHTRIGGTCWSPTGCIRLHNLSQEQGTFTHGGDIKPCWGDFFFWSAGSFADK